MLTAINEAFVDDAGVPIQNIRVRHTIVLEDPFPDPPALAEHVPEKSPEPAFAQVGSGLASEANLTLPQDVSAGRLRDGLVSLTGRPPSRSTCPRSPWSPPSHRCALCCTCGLHLRLVRRAEGAQICTVRLWVRPACHHRQRAYAGCGYEAMLMGPCTVSIDMAG